MENDEVNLCPDQELRNIEPSRIQRKTYMKIAEIAKLLKNKYIVVTETRFAIQPTFDIAKKLA